jgi:hypothetical protein
MYAIAVGINKIGFVVFFCFVFFKITIRWGIALSVKRHQCFGVIIFFIRKNAVFLKFKSKVTVNYG